MKNFSISLYAFHLRQSLSEAPGQVAEDASLLWENLTKLGEQLLRFPQLKDLRSQLICYQNGIYDPKGEQRRPSEWLTANSRSLDLGSIPTGGGFQIHGTLQPFRLNDTYAADLTLSPESPDIPIDVPQLQHFNSEGCLLPSSIDVSEDSLGQTLCLYGEVGQNEQESEKLATACAVALLEGTPLNPKLVNQGKLFGSLLFEYQAIDYDDPENPAQECHILVSLNNSQAPTPKLADEAYDCLLNLLCCYHKIRYVYHQSRLSYQDARQVYSELEKQVQNFSQLPKESTQRLANLKQSLTEVSIKLFDYDSYLRDLQDHRTAIETNATNYEKCLNQLPTLPEDDLGFWQDFLKTNCNHFQEQIQTDFSYLKPGRDLFQQLIAAIRGIVEIEQAESDRALATALREKEEAAEEREKKLEESQRKEEKAAEEREKRLQLWIALVGTGLAVSGISSQTDAKPVEAILTQLDPNQSLDCPKAGLNPCLIYSGFFVLFHVGIGAIASLILWVIIQLVSKGKMDNKSHSSAQGKHF